MLEKHYSLRTAAKLIGVNRKTLHKWLRQDLGILLPRVRRGGKVMIRERDIERVVAKRRDARTAA
jgi:predicted site-specific integrase-resolvase